MDTAALTRDAFLGGRVNAWQPGAGYRAATDPVFLAAACAARPGAQLLELGCGVGVASLCLAARVPDLSLVGVERQPEYADLARHNAADAGIPMRVVTADLERLPPDLRQLSFDHVIANPPYYPADAGTAAADAGRETALREDTPLPIWIATARARLKQGGWLTMIQAADRLPDCLAAMQQGFGAIAVRPLASRMGRPAKRVLVQGRKGARTPFTLLSPLVIHDGTDHGGDFEDYSPAARAVLRDGAALSWDRRTVAVHSIEPIARKG